MQLLDLPLEVFRVIVACTVRKLGLGQSIKVCLVCRLFADAFLDAIITTRVIEDVNESHSKMIKIQYHHNVIARYLHHRTSTDQSDVHPWIATIRDTSQMLAQYTKSEHDPAKIELLERSACSCLAANKGETVFKELNRQWGYPILSEGGIEANCLTVAAWMGDMDLVKLLHKGSDPLAFFGRPSWAAATQGHRDVLQFCLDEGALPYEPTYKSGPNFALHRSPLAAAAFMGRETIVELYLQQPHYRSEMRGDGDLAVFFAAQGNQVNTLKMLLDHVKAKAAPQDWLSTVDWALICSCRRGASASAKIALDYGADINETDRSPRSCLQLAAISGSAPLVKLLLDAGAPLEAVDTLRKRSSGRTLQMRRYRDALFEAKRRGHPQIVQLIEERQQVLAAGT
ncbi:ankyrin [Lentithecium fluviatile CBS 122367]|uniref:Ankyrin n=1 Tax=Lentithecium fluviatile CBS 122367 TaxID=1168545 RepID=A0A6G1JIM1_9PLEO|nr:ankyrin [Lentithecium fluviatile CBS 122367]